MVIFIIIKFFYMIVQQLTSLDRLGLNKIHPKNLNLRVFFLINTKNILNRDNWAVPTHT